MKKIIVASVSVLAVVLVGFTVICLFNQTSFMEGYYNGFIEMQTLPETIAAWFGDKIYFVSNLLH
jgi:hypothetical protein